VTLYQNFLSQSFELNEDMVSFLKEHQLQKLIDTFKSEINSIDWSPEAIQQVMKDISVSLGIKGKPLFMGLRIATTAELHGPSLPNMLALLPKETVISRLHDTLKLW
jgi:glutamyl-tRNA synthetase/nondiscriminating glutamyl-tRNA synthetase